LVGPNQRFLSMTTILPVQSKEHISITATLAKKIWTQHYTPIIGTAQVSYMLDKFQSAMAIENQLKEGILYYLLLHNEVPVGYFSFHLKEAHLFLSKLYVLSTARGHGVGKKAMSFMESQATQLGLATIQLTVNKYNSIAIKAYEKMGFINTAAVIQDIGNGYVMDDYILEKPII